MAPGASNDSISGDNWVAVGNGLMTVRYLQENKPAALTVQNGALTLKPWGDQETFLDIYSRKTWEVQLTQLPEKVNKAAGDRLSAAFGNRLLFWVDPQWVSDSRAWGDFGYVAPCDAEMAKKITRRLRLFSMKGYVERRLKQDWSKQAWRHWGADPEFESGSSSAPGGGYEPLLKTAHLYLTWLQTGDRRFFDEAERVSWHWRDRRYIHFDKPIGTTRWEGSGFYQSNFREGMKKFADLQPPKEQISRYFGAWSYGGRWGPMDTQHFSVDEVVNYYYLTGDRHCLAALDAYGQQAISFAARSMPEGEGGGKVSRAHGWVTRALVAVYEATNEEKFLTAARKAVDYMVKHQDKRIGTISPYDAIATRGKSKGQIERQVPFMGAAVGMSLGRYYRHYPEQRVRDAILGIADWLYYDDAKVNEPKGFSYSWYPNKKGSRSPSGDRCMSTMSWAYLATGKQQYMDAANWHASRISDRRLDEYWQVNGFGQEYMTLRKTGRDDPVAPGAVTDLRAEPLGGGKVKLTWTAPGDDGVEGRSAEVQIKHSNLRIVERSDWREKAGEEISFWAATNVQGEPVPADAGTVQGMVIDGLDPGARYFALKSYDEQPNQSKLSNVVSVEVK
jgi:hypothetical protein